MVKNEVAMSTLIMQIIKKSDLQDLAVMGDVREPKFQDSFKYALVLTKHRLDLDRTKTDDEISTQVHQACMELFGPKE